MKVEISALFGMDWGEDIVVNSHIGDGVHLEEIVFNGRRDELFEGLKALALNPGMLSIEAGDTDRGKQFLNTYLATYPTILSSPTFMLVDPEITSDELERLAETARDKLAAMQSK